MKGLPAEFAYWLRRRLVTSGQGVEIERQYLLAHLAKWRAHPDRVFPLPGYHLMPPKNAPGKTYPAGWSSSNFHHHANAMAKRQRAGINH